MRGSVAHAARTELSVGNLGLLLLRGAPRNVIIGLAPMVLMTMAALGSLSSKKRVFEVGWI